MMANLRSHGAQNNNSPAMDDGISAVNLAEGVALPVASNSGQDAFAPRPTDSTDGLREPNIADPRIHFNRVCVYERRLPGGSYVTAHIQRHQHGFAESNVLGERIEHVDFLAVDFVFHSHDRSKHRFKSATIRMSVQQGEITPSMHSERILLRNPRFLMHAPHLLYGSGSPDNMQWTFNQAGSRGTPEALVTSNAASPGSASRTRKHNDMVEIQGSVRTLKSPRGRRYDVEGGEVVWTLQENKKQKTGLPREFTFAVLLQKPSLLSPVNFAVDIEPRIQLWFASYPRAWLNQVKYEGVQKNRIEFKYTIGQSFQPLVSGYGFNFASMVGTLDDFVQMPGLSFSGAQRLGSRNHTKGAATIERVNNEDSPATDDDEVRIVTPPSHFGLNLSKNAPSGRTPMSKSASQPVSQAHTEPDTTESLPNLDGGRDDFLISTPTLSERLVQTFPRMRQRTLRRTRRSFSLNEAWRRHGTNSIRYIGIAAAPEYSIDYGLGRTTVRTSSDDAH